MFTVSGLARGERKLVYTVSLPNIGTKLHLTDGYIVTRVEMFVITHSISVTNE